MISLPTTPPKKIFFATTYFKLAKKHTPDIIRFDTHLHTYERLENLQAT